jgi:MFS family permease
MPFYLIDGLGFDASRAGLLFATVSMAALITGPLSGWLSDKIGYRVLCTAGIAMMACGLFWLSRLGSSAGPLDILPRLAVMGLGSGLFSSPNNSSIMGSVPRERLSTGSAMIATVRQVGMSTGTAVAGAIYTSRQAWHAAQLGGTTIDVHKLSLISGYRDTLLVAAIVCAVAVIPSAMRGKAVAAPKSPGAQGAPQA